MPLRRSTGVLFCEENHRRSPFLEGLIPYAHSTPGERRRFPSAVFHLEGFRVNPPFGPNMDSRSRS